MPPSMLYRNTAAQVVFGRSRVLLFLDGSQGVKVLPGEFTLALGALLTAVEDGCTFDECLTHATSETVELLLELRLLVDTPPLRTGSRVLLKRLVLGVCGSIAASDTPRLVVALLPFVQSIDIVLTASAQMFVTARGLSALGVRVFTDEDWKTGRASHIDLACAADDRLLVLPATATTIHKIASGACSDLLSATVSASHRPAIIAPAMNNTMWREPAIRRNVRALIDDGHDVVTLGPGFEANDLARRHFQSSWCGVGISTVHLLTLLGLSE